MKITRVTAFSHAEVEVSVKYMDYRFRVDGFDGEVQVWNGFYSNWVLPPDTFTPKQIDNIRLAGLCSLGK